MGQSKAVPRLSHTPWDKWDKIGVTMSKSLTKKKLLDELSVGQDLFSGPGLSHSKEALSRPKTGGTSTPKNTPLVPPKNHPQNDLVPADLERLLPAAVKDWPGSYIGAYWRLVKDLNRADRDSGRRPSPIQLEVAEEAIRRAYAMEDR